MKVLCTFPGRYGDLLWALPTVRLISETLGTPVDLQICGEFQGIATLIAQQPYIGRVIVDDQWGISMGWRPPVHRIWEHDRTFHLGYRRWPELPLPVEIYQTVLCDLELHPLDLERPWIAIDGPGAPCEIACGWSDCHFELKVGLMLIVEDRRWGPNYLCLPPAGSRWLTEAAGLPMEWRDTSWEGAARAIRNSDLFFGDCSALHVLALALGKRVVLMEPMEARHNPIFYPYGQDGPRVILVKGLDGKPTFDARHCQETLKRVGAGL